MTTQRLVWAITLSFPSVIAYGGGSDRELDLLKDFPRATDDLAWQAFHQDPAATLDDVWRMTDGGVLISKGEPKGYIHIQNPYDDFVLTLQWRWPAGKDPGNGGVLLRMTGDHGIWPKSLEAQINAGNAGDFWGLMGYQLDGPADRLTRLDHAQFGKLTNLKKTTAAEKPAGSWNSYEIRALGDVVTVTINGQVVNRATGCEVVQGRICLTAEGDEIHFRNVRLAPIENPKHE